MVTSLNEQELLYVRFIGRTASYRIPTTISGVQLTLEIPSYSTIIGMLSVILGRKYMPKNQAIGIRYTYETKNFDLETTHRWKRDSKNGKITYHGTNPRRRQVHYNPLLEIFLTDTALEEELHYPKRTPTLGRSQDIAKIDLIKRIKAVPVNKGKVNSTLIPVNFTNTKNFTEQNNMLPKQDVMQGVLYVLPTDFDVSELGKIRIPLNFNMFLGIPKAGQEIEFQQNVRPQLYSFRKQDIQPPPNFPWNENEQTVYLYYY